MDNNLTDYNYLKSLPKDILIKILTEINEECIKSRKKWFTDIVKNNRLDVCPREHCYKILYEYSEDFFNLCETCNEVMCKECINKEGIVYQLCTSCNYLPMCPKCFNKGACHLCTSSTI